MTINSTGLLILTAPVYRIDENKLCPNYTLVIGALILLWFYRHEMNFVGHGSDFTNGLMDRAIFAGEINKA